MEARGLKEEDLVVPVKMVSTVEMADIMQSQDVVVSF